MAGCVRPAAPQNPDPGIRGPAGCVFPGEQRPKIAASAIGPCRKKSVVPACGKERENHRFPVFCVSLSPEKRC
ncbi:MAG: hypothetical protein C6W57_09155 [Caldibacillus debilis]|nr:MAG: hypothetical protein C6W57_09155 [Caldibacillus debilis]